MPTPTSSPLIAIRTLTERLRALEPIESTSYSLALNVVLTSGTGAVFWVIAARLCTPEQVGRDSALVAAMLLLSTVCSLNLASAIMRFLPIIKLNATSSILGSYALAAAASAIGGLIYVLVAPAVDHKFAFLSENHWLAVIFVLSVVSWTVFTLQDAVLTAMQQAHWVAVENGLFGVLKIAVLPIALAIKATSDHAVFTSWMLPMVLLLIPVNWAIFRRFAPSRNAPEHELSPVERFGRRGIALFMARDYAASLFLQAATTALPIVVVALLGARQGAEFYIPFTIISAVDLLFLNVASSLTVEAARAPDRLRELVVLVVRRFSWLLSAIVLILALGAHFVLLPYGTTYAYAGTTLLRLLAITTVFRAITSLRCAVWRVEGHADRVLYVQALGFALTIGFVVVIGRGHGLAGVGLGWLAGNTIPALLVVVLWAVGRSA